MAVPEQAISRPRATDRAATAATDRRNPSEVDRVRKLEADRSWAEIGRLVGQRKLSITADTYTHVLSDGRELDLENLLGRARTVPPSVPPSAVEIAV